jgi:peptide chain release factor
MLAPRFRVIYSPPLPSLSRLLQRSFHSSTPLAGPKPLNLPPRMKIPDSDIKHVFTLGRGPGGQVINKTSSAAQLTHIPTGIVVKNQETRSRTQNYKIARRILTDKVDEFLNGDESRVKIKQGKMATKKRSAEKKSRRKYRAIEERKEKEALKQGDQAVLSREDADLDQGHVSGEAVA